MTGLPAWMPRAGHGTEARCRRHYREGTKPCPACLEAKNRVKRLQKTERKDKAS